MTGRQLIIYILENNLEDEEIFKNNEIWPGFMTVEEAALNFNVSTNVIELWIKMRIIPSIKIGNEIYIPLNARKGAG